MWLAYKNHPTWRTSNGSDKIILTFVHTAKLRRKLKHGPQKWYPFIRRPRDHLSSTSSPEHYPGLWLNDDACAFWDELRCHRCFIIRHHHRLIHNRHYPQRQTEQQCARSAARTPPRSAMLRKDLASICLSTLSIYATPWWRSNSTWWPRTL